MLSDKQFCERSKVELREIANQLRSLATDRDLYQKLEREVVPANPQLKNTRSPFLDMLRGAYTDAMAARLLRLLDSASDGLSLPRVMAQLAGYPHLLHDKVTERELLDDRAALEQASARINQVLDPHFAHHERTPSALASIHRELDRALDALTGSVKTYYWVIADGHVDLDVSYAEDPLQVFRFAWIPQGPTA